MAELPVMQDGRIFKVPPMPLDTAKFLADHGDWPNAALGRKVRWMLARWERENGRWVRRNSLPQSTRVAVLRRDKGECQYCGAYDCLLEIDHITPVVAGGSDEIENLCVACRLCNRLKGAKSLEEFFKMQWFRLHTKILHDPRVQTMSAERYKLYINLLCHACEKDENGNVGNVSDVAFVLRETQEAVSSAFHDFKERGLIATDGETFHIPQWSKKQYKSDNSTSRVKKFREKMKRNRNVSETAPETEQNRAESEVKEEPNGPSFTKRKKYKKRKEASGGAAPQFPMPDDEATRQIVERLAAPKGYGRLVSHLIFDGRCALERFGEKYLINAANQIRADMIDQRLGGELNEILGRGNWEITVRKAAA